MASSSSSAKRKRGTGVVDTGHFERLVAGFQAMFEKKSCLDLWVKVEATAAEVHMHGLIACAASPVLLMLREKMQGNENSIVVSNSEVDSSSLDLVVDYMYYGSLALTAENVCGLLSSANYLELVGAVELCVQYMCNHITVRTALNANRLGNLYDLENLRAFTIDFIARRAGDVIGTDEWKLATADQLACIFDKDVLAGVTEFDIFSALVRWVAAADDEEDRLNRLSDFKTLLGDDRVLRVKYMSAAEIASMKSDELVQSIEFDQPFGEMIQNRVETSDVQQRCHMLVPTSVETNLTHHTRGVYCLLVHDNKLYSGSSDDTIGVYDLARNQLEATLTHHTSAVISLLVHDNKLYSGSEDSTIAVYDLARNQLEAALTHHTASVRCLLVHDNKLYSGSNDSTIAVYDLARNQLETTLTHHYGCVDCLFVHDNKLYSGSADDTIAVYDLTRNQLETTLTHHDCVECLVVHDNKLYSGSSDGTIAVYDLGRNQLETTLTHHADVVRCLLVHDNKLYSGSWDNTIAVYDLARNQLEATLTHHTGSVWCLLVHDNKLYSGSCKTIAVWHNQKADY